MTLTSYENLVCMNELNSKNNAWPDWIVTVRDDAADAASAMNGGVIVNINNISTAKIDLKRFMFLPGW